MSSSLGDTQKTQTTQSTTQPWSTQAPYLEKGLQRADALYNSPGPTYFPQSTVTGFSPNQLQAQQRGVERSQNGNPVMGASADYAQKSINGDFLNTGDQNGMIFRDLQSKIMPAINSQFENSGRYGSNLQGDTLSRAMTEAYAPYLQQNYQQERGAQQQMALNAPQYAQNDYMDIAAQDAIGTQQQQLGQQELQDAVNRYTYNQDLPYNKLAQYAGLIGGNWGGQTTSQQPYTQPGLFSTLLGGGLAAAGTAGKLGWQPFG